MVFPWVFHEFSMVFPWLMPCFPLVFPKKLPIPVPEIRAHPGAFICDSEHFTLIDAVHTDGLPQLRFLES